MTILEKLRRCAGSELSIRNIDGALWATDDSILVRLDGITADEEGPRHGETIKRAIEGFAAALPCRESARLSALGIAGGQLIREVVVEIDGGSAVTHYIMEQYIGLMRGNPYWLPGSFRGPSHALVNFIDGELVCVVKGMRDDDVAPKWKPITNGCDPEAEAEYYRNLALYPEEE